MDDSPPPFNPHYQAGLKEAVDKEYTEWSNAHPDHTQEEGIKAYQEIIERLRKCYAV